MMLRIYGHSLHFCGRLTNPLGNQTAFNLYVDRKKSIGIYKPDLDPLYERIKKTDLGLKEPVFENHRVELRPIQRKIYDLIAAKTLQRN